MANANAAARAVILDRYRSAAPAEIGGPSVFQGWPGLVLLGQCIERELGRPVPSVTELALRWRHAEATLPRIPPRYASSFVYGERGLTWAEDTLAGRATGSLRPPPAPVGFDTFANDAPVFFAACRRREPSTLAAWAEFTAREVQTLDRMTASGRPVPLGFAHGVAGLLFRALRLAGLHPAFERDALVARFDWLANWRHEDEQGARWPAKTDEAPADSWVVHSLCNGSLGHALVFVEAGVRLEHERFIHIAQQALRTTRDESETNGGFCCGQAGRAAIVSRFLRLGVRPRSTEAIGCLQRLQARIPRVAHEHTLRPISGLASCLPALYAEAPDSPILDFFLPEP
ncbi:MAG: lanthionine synthetase LanC family protein [Myxococcota bacterium]